MIVRLGAWTILLLALPLVTANVLGATYLGVLAIVLLGAAEAFEALADSVAMRVLEKLDVDPSRVRSEIHTIVESASVNERPTHGLTPSAKRVIELSVQEANRLRCNYVGTEHLLLGLMSEREGLAAAVLVNLTGADLAGGPKRGRARCQRRCSAGAT